jgi:hypothetical protein
MNSWFYVRGGQPVGPVPFAALCELAHRGELAPEDLTCRPGQGGWALAASHPELAAYFPRRKSRAKWLLLLGAVAAMVLAGGAGLALHADPPAEPTPAAEDVEPAPATSLPVLSPRQRQINEALTRGVAYLKQSLRGSDPLFYRAAYMRDFNDKWTGKFPRGSAHVGAVALAGLTLLECGVPAEDRSVRAAAQAVREAAPGLNMTYSVAVSVLFLDRLHQGKTMPAKDRELMQRLTLRLVAAQRASGLWGYDTPPRTPAEEEQLLGRLRSNAYTPQGQGYHNISNSQFAAMALWAARRHQLPVGPALRAAAESARRRQHADGSWNYMAAADGAYMADSATCAGLIFLALGRAVEADSEAGKSASAASRRDRPEKSAPQDPAMAKAFRRLEAVIGKAELPAAKRVLRQQLAYKQKLFNQVVETGKGTAPKTTSGSESDDWEGSLVGTAAWGDLYFLWSLERVAVVYDRKQIGGKDWYDWGADVILKHQRDDGSWADRFPGVPDTCFALLFLRRANLARDLTDKLRELLSQSPAVALASAPAPGRKE